MTADPLGDRAQAVRAASRSLSALLDMDERGRAILADGELPEREGYVAIAARALADGGIEELRVEKRRRLLQIAAWDLNCELSLERVGAALADLADACIEAVLGVDPEAEALAVLAFGKLGARELNYVSDIDLVFVAAGDPAPATSAAQRLLGALGAHSPHAPAYTVDLALRPEGRSGPLVRSLEGCVQYYRRWAQPWELQALIKARPAAGATSVGEALVAATREIVWRDEVDAERVASIRRMKERIEEHAARPNKRVRSGAERDVKLGPGGIRDIEFSAQLLQLVHGGSDPSVRAAGTLPALEALARRGYIADEDGAGLSVAYRWLRAVEHRLQLRQERRVRMVPTSGEELASLAHALRFRDAPERSAAERFTDAHASVLSDVRARFERLFYRPMIEALADPGGGRLGRDALRERLHILGFRDVEKAARTLEALVAGTSRRAKLLRVLTPAMLRFLSGASAPDAGLLSFLRLSESLGGRLDALGALRDNPPGLRSLAHALGSGSVVGDLLAQVPEELALFVRDVPDNKERAQLEHEARASLRWRAPEERLAGLRRFKRREWLRIILSDLRAPTETAVGARLSDLADACLAAMLTDADAVAVLALGKLGGRELNLASDLDLMFVYEGDGDRAHEVASALLEAIGEVTPEGKAFTVDLGLRPEGRAGPLVRSLESCVDYYARWAQPWERLAMQKIRRAAGSEAIADRLLSEVEVFAFPGSVDRRTLESIRHLKARMGRERIPRGVDARRHLKLGPGCMSDIEFAAALQQFVHGHRHEHMRAANTLDAIEAARACSAIDESSARRMSDAYRFLARLRDRLFLLTGRPTDVLPNKPELLESLGIAMGFHDQPRQEVEERYLRVTRRARQVTDALIYG
jgi:glutamate-ammonia-ligase adenylyltransferase